MGMDISGLHPTTKEGEYFRNNVWWWRPLADYICEVAPTIACHNKYWQSNDGGGLNADQSIALADALQAELDAGRTLAYERRYTSEQEATPNIACTICAGTGTRLAVPRCGAGDPNNGGFKCNGCNGTGFVRPNNTLYPFSADNVQKFTTFLRGCGGFEIW